MSHFNAVTNSFPRVVMMFHRATTKLLLITVAVGIGVIVTSCNGVLPNPNTALNSSQVMLDLQNALLQTREDYANMQAQIDSLRGAVAYQDTIIRMLATSANVSVRPPASSFP